jgi:hypothetical protein
LQDGLKDLQAEHLRAYQLDGYAVDLDEVAPGLIYVMATVVFFRSKLSLSSSN